jgi:hypothetical protein
MFDVQMIAKKATRYNGRQLKAGDKFQARSQDVRILKLLKHADEENAEVAIEEATSKKRQRYQRRDIRADE